MLQKKATRFLKTKSAELAQTQPKLQPEGVILALKLVH